MINNNLFDNDYDDYLADDIVDCEFLHNAETYEAMEIMYDLMLENVSDGDTLDPDSIMANFDMYYDAAISEMSVSSRRKVDRDCLRDYFFNKLY